MLTFWVTLIADLRIISEESGVSASHTLSHKTRGGDHLLRTVVNTPIQEVIRLDY